MLRSGGVRFWEDVKKWGQRKIKKFSATNQSQGVYELLCKRPIGRKLLHFKGIA